MTIKSTKEKEKEASEVEIEATPTRAKRTAKEEEKDDDNQQPIMDARNIGPKEVFDSSKYDAMSDMTDGARLKTDNVEILTDAPSTERLKPEQIRNKAISSKTISAEKYGSDANSTNNLPKITPMMVEERARTIRAVNEEIKESDDSAYQSKSSNDRFVLYLNLMLSIENAANERLHARIQQSILPQIREQLITHLQESREQRNRLGSLIQKLGGQPTDERAELPSYAPPKSLAESLDALATTPEEQELKTTEVDALIEYAEVIGYNTLIQMATKMNIGEALPPLRQNLQEEENMVAWMRANTPSNFVRLWSKIEELQSPPQAQ